MNSVKMFLLGWVAGVLAGLVLMERWHRKGARHFLEADDRGETVEFDTETIAMTVSSDQRRVTAVLIAGARADAEHARQLLMRAVPMGGRSVPSFAQLRRRTSTQPPGDHPNS